MEDKVRVLTLSIAPDLFEGFNFVFVGGV